MEAEPSLVRAKGAVELDAETTVDMDLALIVLPGYPEDDLPLRFTDALDNFAVRILGMLHQDRSKALENFPDSLMELHFTRIALKNVLKDTFDLFIHLHCHLSLLYSFV